MEKILIIPDTHFPFHDEASVELVVAVCAAIKPEKIVHLGDILDAEIWSSHPGAMEEEGRAHSFLKDEIEPAREWMKRCTKYGATWSQLEGNHEFRVSRACVKAGLSGMGSFDLLDPKRLLAAEMPSDYRWVPYSPRSGVDGFLPLVHGALIAVHGWSYAKAAAAVHLEKARSRSIVFGHCHRAMSVSTRDPFTGQVLKSWCPGTTSVLAPRFLHGAPSDWVRGISIVYVGDSGRSFTDYTCIIDHKDTLVLPNGKEIK